jgi:hypothetical protein
MYPQLFQSRATRSDRINRYGYRLGRKYVGGASRLIHSPTNKNLLSQAGDEVIQLTQKTLVTCCQEELPFYWWIAISSISLSVVELFLRSERFESAFVAIRGGDFQVSILRESGQDNGSFESCDFRLVTIIMWNIPLSQNVDRNSSSINTFSVFEHIFNVIE